MTPEDLRKQAWDFFQMQAGQRLTTFNFYIAIASLLATGLGATVKADIDLPLIGTVVGLFLMFFSFIFWKLDQRNRVLIQGAERTLIHFEEQSDLDNEPDGRPHIAKRFAREDFETKTRRAHNTWNIWRNHYGYYGCFEAVFVAFALVGLIGAVYSALRLLGYFRPAGVHL